MTELELAEQLFIRYMAHGMTDEAARHIAKHVREVAKIFYAVDKTDKTDKTDKS